MLTRKNRFHGHNAVRSVYRHGRTVRGNIGTLHYEANDHRHGYRAAVVVSKKVNKSAVARNRIRRRLYEIIRRQAPAFNQPCDIVLTVYQDKVASVPADELERDVIALLTQARLLEK